MLPAPNRTSAGYRDYSDEAIDRVVFIRQAQAAGLTLAQSRDILAIRDRGQTPCQPVALLVDQRLDDIAQRFAELERTRAELLTFRDRLASLDPADCRDDICWWRPRSPPVSHPGCSGVEAAG